MRNLLAFFAAMLLTFAGVGWYLGWYNVKNLPSGDGERSLNVSINTAKIGLDFRKGAKATSEWLGKRAEDKPIEKQTPFEKVGLGFATPEEEPDTKATPPNTVPRVPAPEFGS